MQIETWNHNGVGIIRWQRGRLNPVDEALGRAVAEALQLLAGKKDIKAIVLAGSKEAFSAGGDLARAWEALKQGEDPSSIFKAYTDWVGRTVKILWQVPKLTVSAVEGVVAGAGLGWMVGSDLVVAGREARILPGFARVGLVAAAGITWALGRGIGPKRGMWWLGFNRELTAHQAARWGLVDEVVEKGLALQRAVELARDAGGRGWIKPGTRRAWAKGLKGHMRHEQLAVMAASRGMEFAERMQEFFER